MHTARKHGFSNLFMKRTRSDSGGSTKIAVLRTTLTHFKDWILASRFSGRWDDSIEKDKDGNFFIDQDPKVFGVLLKYLRQGDQGKGDDIEIPPPSPTFLHHTGIPSHVLGLSTKVAM